MLILLIKKAIERQWFNRKKKKGYKEIKPYYAARTNYFRVTDEEKYQELFSKLVSEDEIKDLTEIKDGITYHGFGAYAPIRYLDNDEYDLDMFLEELQKILSEDEAFVYFEISCEELRYLVGYLCIVTHNEIRELDINSWFN